MKNICGRVFVDQCALCMMIMASIFLSGLGWVVLQACFVGWVGSISYWVGLGWITEIEPTSMSVFLFWQPVFVYLCIVCFNLVICFHHDKYI